MRHIPQHVIQDVACDPGEIRGSMGTLFIQTAGRARSPLRAAPAGTMVHCHP